MKIFHCFIVSLLVVGGVMAQIKQKPVEVKIERKLIVCQNRAEFDSLNARIHRAMQRDVKGYHADRWAEPIMNTKDNQQIAFPIKKRIEKYLTIQEKTRKVTLDEEWLPEADLTPVISK